VLGIYVLGIYVLANSVHSNRRHWDLREPMPNAKLQRPDAKFLLRLILLWPIVLF
jgi:hypothetical protein